LCIYIILYCIRFHWNIVWSEIIYYHNYKMFKFFKYSTYYNLLFFDNFQCKKNIFWESFCNNNNIGYFYIFLWFIFYKMTNINKIIICFCLQVGYLIWLAFGTYLFTWPVFGSFCLVSSSGSFHLRKIDYCGALANWKSNGTVLGHKNIQLYLKIYIGDLRNVS